ncbi:MAG TPA: 50S ribosomal protein L24 [Patescibacteria group bacterium]|nr:50S ribosomal protein L24 [Patescibacteria group bacterium]
MKIHKGDLVTIVGGKDEGKTGKIEKVLTKEAKVVVDGVNQYKRHIKARTQGQQSEIVTITKPLAISNVALICPHCKQVTRVGYVVSKDSKQRICRKCKAEI